MSLSRIVIVGASVAGLSAADTLRDEGFEGEIVVLGDETHLPYDRPPLSKEFLLGDAGPAAQARPLRPADHFDEMGIELRSGVRATGLAPMQNLLHTTAGSEPFDALIIASGCRARHMLTSSGTPLPSVRTLDDALTLRDRLDKAQSAILIGTGFIGLEVASVLRQNGLAVTVIGNMPMPLAQCVGPEVSDWVQRLHESHGVRILNSRTITAVEALADGFRVRLADGEKLQADLVLAGIGVIPNTDWLNGSGVVCEDGILCATSGLTSRSGVWAAGDVAAYPAADGRSQRIEHWTNAVEQGRHVAMNILNESEDAFVSLPYAWSDQFNAKLQTLGRFVPGDRTVIVEGDLSGPEFLALHGQGDAFHAVTASVASPSLRTYRKLLRRNATFSEALTAAQLDQPKQKQNAGGL